MKWFWLWFYAEFSSQTIFLETREATCQIPPPLSIDLPTLARYGAEPLRDQSRRSRPVFFSRFRRKGPKNKKKLWREERTSLGSDLDARASATSAARAEGPTQSRKPLFKSHAFSPCYDYSDSHTSAQKITSCPACYAMPKSTVITARIVNLVGQSGG